MEKIRAAGAQAKTLETEKKQREEKSAHRLENYYNVPANLFGNMDSSIARTKREKNSYTIQCQRNSAPVDDAVTVPYNAFRNFFSSISR